jgi:hypothetical protein
MKTFAVSVALGTILAATAAQAAEQRPTYISFKPSANAAASTTVAPATPSVAKRKGLAPSAVFPIIGGTVAAGVGIALLVKKNKDDTSPE